MQERADGHRTFDNAADHHFAARLDALGDGDLAFPGQQFHRSHFAQIHAYRIVGAADFVFIDVAGGAFRFRFLGFFRRVFGFFVFDHVDAGFGQHRHGVLDLLGGDLIRRQRRVELIVGDVADFLAARDHLFDRGV